MAWSSDDQQVHKQLIVGGKTSSSVGKSDDEKILGSAYVENGVHVGSPDAFGLMEGTCMVNKSSEQQGEFAMEVQDDQHIRDNLWVEQETKTKTLVADKIDVRKAFITTINKGSCNFVIDHAKKPGYKLRYTCMEGPTKDVFVRGRLKNGDTITLPEEWEWLVDGDSVTVDLTSIGQIQQLFVISQDNKTIKIGGLATNGKYNYTVYGERKDVEKLEVNI